MSELHIFLAITAVAAVIILWPKRKTATAVGVAIVRGPHFSAARLFFGYVGLLILSNAASIGCVLLTKTLIDRNSEWGPFGVFLLFIFCLVMSIKLCLPKGYMDAKTKNNRNIGDYAVGLTNSIWLIIYMFMLVAWELG